MNCSIEPCLDLVKNFGNRLRTEAGLAESTESVGSARHLVTVQIRWISVSQQPGRFSVLPLCECDIRLVHCCGP